MNSLVSPRMVSEKCIIIFSLVINDNVRWKVLNNSSSDQVWRLERNIFDCLVNTNIQVVKQGQSNRYFMKISKHIMIIEMPLNETLIFSEKTDSKIKLN